MSEKAEAPRSTRTNFATLLRIVLCKGCLRGWFTGAGRGVRRWQRGAPSQKPPVATSEWKGSSICGRALCSRQTPGAARKVQHRHVGWNGSKANTHSDLLVAHFANKM